MRILVFIFFLLSFSGYSQKILQGIIIDESTGNPLDGANVFVANSTFKTITNANGKFYLLLPDAPFEIVVSFVGYGASLVNSAAFTDLSKTYTIKLISETEQLRPVSILPASTRAKYLKFFKATLLGTSRNADKSTIVNLDAVNVDFNLETNKLEAFAFEPLIIENPELNYRLTFVLASFELDTHSGTSKYSGHPVYEELEVLSERARKKVEKERLRAYRGSPMHFIRSLYQEKLKDEGFVVDAFSIKPNPAYPGADSVKAMIDEARKTMNIAKIAHIPKRDIITFTRTNLSVTDIVATESEHKFIGFSDYLQVIYKNENVESNYAARNHIRSERQTSQLSNLNQRVEIFSNGNYTDPNNLILHGYFGWERLADLLPFDYLPPENP